MDNIGEFYAAVGADSAVILKRLGGNAGLVKMLLGKFPKDGSFSSLVSALAEGKTGEAFRAAHTLKGVTANLGIESLYKLSSEVTEFLRAGNAESAKTAMPGLSAEYDRVCALIAGLS